MKINKKIVYFTYVLKMGSLQRDGRSFGIEIGRGNQFTGQVTIGIKRAETLLDDPITE